APVEVFSGAVPLAAPGPWLDWPWKGVDWRMSYIASLVFLYVIVSYQFPLGTVSILTGLLGLLFLKDGIRVTPPLMVFAAFVIQAALGYFISPYKGFLLLDEPIAWNAMQDVVK